MEKRTNQELMALRHEHVPPGPFNITRSLSRGPRAPSLRTLKVRSTLDFAGGIGVENVGHCAELHWRTEMLAIRITPELGSPSLEAGTARSYQFWRY